MAVLPSRLLYTLGYTSWEGPGVAEPLAELLAAPDAAPARALEIGCGSGRDAAYLAEQGWEVTAIDAAAAPLRKARERSTAVRWLRCDVHQLPDLGLEPGFSLIYDRGCFEGLGTFRRGTYADAVTKLAGTGARLLMMGCIPHSRVLPGMDGRELRGRFGQGWDLVADRRDLGPAPEGPARHLPRRWYLLVRRL